MNLTRRGIGVLISIIATAILIGMSIQDTVCMEDEAIVWDNDSHSRCVHIDDFQDWMNEQND